MQRTPFLGTLTGSLQQSWGFLWADQFHRDAHPLIRQYVCVCVFSYCRTYYKEKRCEHRRSDVNTVCIFFCVRTEKGRFVSSKGKR